ncbi:pyocin knob domain-containing S74 family peptidase [Rahnella perminowiae]|uniref:pyocin knob domain-containing S74 family peptidase n=1 Tax=Rahnella perminowiae TaxID=2816244 RepID=UPI001EE5723D|nr:pyocin knob domain-containing S74 family peptidase [Rahnella perminowiae]
MSAGTIALTNNSANVTGTGTAFTTDLKAGDFIVVIVGGVTYTLGVKATTSATALTLITPYNGPTATGNAWTAVPNATLIGITAQVAADVAKAIRGLNLDKANWQQVFSGTGNITVTLPDGSTYTGPAWNDITATLTKAYNDGGLLNATVTPNSLGNAADFNIYYQTANANALIANGYPIGKAGTLFVTKSAYGCQQMYITFQGEAFVRGLTGNFNSAAPNWSDWTPIFTGKSTIPLANGGTGATTAAAARSALGITPGNIGALATTGGTMAGNINSSTTGVGFVKLASGVSGQINNLANAYFNSTQYMQLDLINNGANVISRIVTWNGSYHVFGFYDNGNGVCDGSWVGGSDERFKGNIADFTDGLVATLSCRHVTYDKQDGGREIGVIAQDVERFAECAVFKVGKKEFGNGRVIEDFKGLNTAGFAAAAHGNAITSLFELLDLALNDPDAARSKIAEYKAAIVPPVPLTAEEKIFGGKTMDEMPDDTDFTDTDLVVPGEEQAS